ncbi:PqqD family protein [Longibacter salinarum]|uniref:PqqD family protein n=1 Tax=Longibacter salinarum TaxID=1850348 RepID=A0A2A8CZ95_9BACT|nr:PqqD family protein [Longibacter salinarum]PEN14005.1 PqqD family protein [Longibacter salinarum]
MSSNPMTTQSPNLNTCLKADSQHVSSDLAGEQVILNLDNGVYYSLNEVGSQVWSLLKQPRTLHEVVDDIAGDYPVPRDRIEADVVTLAGDLLEAGLVSVIED